MIEKLAQGHKLGSNEASTGSLACQIPKPMHLTALHIWKLLQM